MKLEVQNAFDKTCREFAQQSHSIHTTEKNTIINLKVRKCINE